MHTIAHTQQRERERECAPRGSRKRRTGEIVYPRTHFSASAKVTDGTQSIAWYAARFFASSTLRAGITGWHAIGTDFPPHWPSAAAGSGTDVRGQHRYTVCWAARLSGHTFRRPFWRGRRSKFALVFHNLNLPHLA